MPKKYGAYNKPLSEDKPPYVTTLPTTPQHAFVQSKNTRNMVQMASSLRQEAPKMPPYPKISQEKSLITTSINYQEEKLLGPNNILNEILKALPTTFYNKFSLYF